MLNHSQFFRTSQHVHHKARGALLLTLLAAISDVGSSIKQALLDAAKCILDSLKRKPQPLFRIEARLSV